MHQFMRIFRFLSIVAICSFLGFGLWRLADLGYFRPWERITPTPDDKAQYLTMTLNPPPQHLVTFTKPCDFSKPEFAFSARPTAGIVDCLQRQDLFPDRYERTTYVLDSAGSVWIWDHSVSAYITLLRMLLWPGAGFIIGILIALVVEAS